MPRSARTAHMVRSARPQEGADGRAQGKERCTCRHARKRSTDARRVGSITVQMLFRRVGGGCSHTQELHEIQEKRVTACA